MGNRFSTTKLLKIVIVLSLLLIFSTLPSNGQNRKKFTQDSISERIEIDKLNNLSYLLIDSSKSLSYKSLAYKFGIEALDRSQKMNYDKGVVQSKINLGLFYTITCNYIKAYECYYSALTIANNSGLTAERANVYKKIGNLCTILKQLDKAKTFLLKALSLSESFKDTFNICDNLIFLGKNANEMADTQMAIHYYSMAQKLIEKFNNPILTSGVNRALGDLYLSTKAYEKATKYYLKVIETNNQANVHFANNTGAVYTLLAYIAQIKGNYQIALQYNKMALEWRKNHKQIDQYISSLLNVGNSYLDLNQYDSTLYYLKSGLDLAIQNKIYLLVEYGYQNLYKFYQEKHDWKTAFIFFKKFTEAKDSVQAVNYRYNITLFETNQVLSETEKKNEILKGENDIQKLNLKIKTIQIIVLLSFIFLFLIIIVLVYRLYIKNKRSRIALKSINSRLDAEVEDRKKIAEQLRESESLHRFLTEHSMDIISRMDSKFNFTYVSPSCRNIYGFEPSELMSVSNQAEIIHPEFLQSMHREYSEMIRRREPVKFRYRTKGKDGNYFWVESHVNPIFDEMTGELRESIAVIHDVTDRVDQEDAFRENAKQKELLIREIHHRSKNNMGILISIISLQKNKTRNKELLDNLTDLQSRVRTMTLVHDQLYRSRNIVTLSFLEYLENLTSTIAMAFKCDNINLHTDIQESYFDVEVSLTLGLILNELLTNAFKYAFPGNKQGNIRVGFRALTPRQKKGENKEMNWILSVKDDGIGLPPDFSLETTSSLGMQIISTLTEQLHGKVNVESKDGTRFSIYLPELKT